MRCETVVKELDRYRTGESPPGRTESLTNHLENCPECAAQLADLRRLASSLSGLRRTSRPNIVRRVMEESMDSYGVVETELGAMWVGFNARGITMVRPGADAGEFDRIYLHRRFSTAVP